MNFIDVLNAATADISDYRLAKKLSISSNTVSAWRNRGTIPSDEILEELSIMSGIPLNKVLCAAYAEKIHNPVISELLRNNSHLAA
jgi:transcriptional regulator with XRE-family HTH domain